MTSNDSIAYRIWRIVYPLLIYFLLDVLIVWLVQYLTVLLVNVTPDSFLGRNTPAIGAIIFLAVSIVVCYKIYQKDYNEPSRWIYQHPGYFALLAVMGILASHGLSALISLISSTGMLGNYQEIEQNVFVASPVLVIVQTVILAPLSEELLFRGILYRRLQGYIHGFWGPALISSAIFGLYHMNLAQGIFAFIFGLFICAVYERIRNLWAAIALHAGGNLISVVLVYTGFQYPETWQYITAMVLALAAAGALFYLLIRRTSGNKG